MFDTPFIVFGEDGAQASRPGGVSSGSDQQRAKMVKEGRRVLRKVVRHDSNATEGHSGGKSVDNNGKTSEEGHLNNAQRAIPQRQPTV